MTDETNPPAADDVRADTADAAPEVAEHDATAKLREELEAARSEYQGNSEMPAMTLSGGGACYV